MSFIHHPSRTRLAVAALAASAAMLTFASPVSAHVSPGETELEAGSVGEVSMTIKHGCKDLPTIGLKVKVPSEVSVLAVGSPATPGWTSETVPSTDGATEVTWTAPLDAPVGMHEEATFTLSVQVADVPAGTMLLLPVVQQCPGAQLDWIEPPLANGDEPDYPAPMIKVIAASVAASSDSPAGTVNVDTTAASTVVVGSNGTADSTAAQQATSNNDTGSDPLVVIVIAGVAGAAIAGGVLRWRSVRKAGSA